MQSNQYLVVPPHVLFPAGEEKIEVETWNVQKVR